MIGVVGQIITDNDLKVSNLILPWIETRVEPVLISNTLVAVSKKIMKVG